MGACPWTNSSCSACALGELIDRFAYVIPSFRSEPLRHGDRAWISEGPSGHWDYDVDDALALVNVAFASTPEARPGSFSIFGGSRGAGVALLAGIRDPRVERIVAFFGPTDFFDDWIRVIARKTALDGPWDLPGLIHLDSTVDPTASSAAASPWRRRALISSVAPPSSSPKTFPPCNCTTERQTSPFP